MSDPEMDNEEQEEAKVDRGWRPTSSSPQPRALLPKEVNLETSVRSPESPAPQNQKHRSSGSQAKRDGSRDHHHHRTHDPQGQPHHHHIHHHNAVVDHPARQLRAVLPVTRYKTYDPRNFPVKTVLWFTRDEIQTLKSFTGCSNVALTILSLIFLLVMGILALTKSYPFTLAAGIQVQKVFSVLLMFQLMISLTAEAGIRSEKSGIIDAYIGSCGILIVSFVLVLVFFSYFADPSIIQFFQSTILFKTLTSFIIIVNVASIWSAFVVELQIRTYGSVSATNRRSVDSGEAEVGTSDAGSPAVGGHGNAVLRTVVPIEDPVTTTAEMTERQRSSSPPLTVFVPEEPATTATTDADSYAQRWEETGRR